MTATSPDYRGIARTHLGNARIAMEGVLVQIGYASDAVEHAAFQAEQKDEAAVVEHAALVSEDVTTAYRVAQILDRQLRSLYERLGAGR